nr:unnamed protein product [Callosobruchus analis]
MKKKTIPKIKNFTIDVLNKYDNHEINLYFEYKIYSKQFRVSKSTFHILVEMFKGSEFAVNKCELRNVAQIFNTSISTMFVIIERLMSFLMSVGPKIIRFPDTTDKKESLAAEFLKIAGFAGVLGCIDGSYIPIRTPA